MHIVIQNIIRFILLVLLQVLLLDNIQFMGYIVPMVYILFVLLLPLSSPRWLTLLLAFVMGLIIDSFNNTPGMHTSAIVLMAFLRDPILQLFVSYDEVPKLTPSFLTLGLSTFSKYLIILVVIHHTFLFILDAFSFYNISILVPKLIISIFVNLVLIFAISSFSYLKK